MKFFINISILIIIFILPSISVAQTGGKYAYQFLSLPSSARLTGLGGSLISVIDDDITLAWSNPASLNEKTHQQISFSHQFHLADVQNSYVAYGHHLKKWKIDSHVALHHFNYGEFKYANEIGLTGGTFSASESAFVFGASKSFDQKLSIGVNLKAITSNLETYNSFGLASDIGLIYNIDSAYTTLGFVIKNIGGEINSFNSTNYSAPFDVQLGFSKRLKYLPFRFSIIAMQLQRWNVRYDDPNQNIQQNIFGETTTESELNKQTDNFFRHLSFNGEFLLGKSQNLRLRGAYNHIRRKELSVGTLRSLAGFSIGFGIKVSHFKLDYGVGYHHVAGATNHISIHTNFKSFKRKV